VVNAKQILFHIEQVRLEARSGGEVLKALEVFERNVREEPEPLAEGYVSQRGMQEYEEMRWTLSIYPRHSKHANIPVTVTVTKRKP